MRWFLTALAFFWLTNFALAAGTCTGAVAVTASAGGTQIVASSDLANGRHFLSLQNIGANPANCTLGETPTTSNGYYLLGSGLGSLILKSISTSTGAFNVPNTAVMCIGNGGATTVTVCDY